MLEVHALPEWHRARVNIHMLTHPVSAPSCALLGLILCIHPDRLTDAPIDSTSSGEHRERLAEVLYSEHEHAAKMCSNDQHVQTSWQPAAPEVLIIMMNWVRAKDEACINSMCCTATFRLCCWNISLMQINHCILNYYRNTDYFIEVVIFQNSTIIVILEFCMLF